MTDYNSATGVVTYTYTADGAAEAHSGCNDILDPFSIIAVDDEGDTESALLNVEITDVDPTANADVGYTLTEDLGRTETVTLLGSTQTATQTITTAAGNVFGATGASPGDVADVQVDTNSNPVTNISNNAEGTSSTVATSGTTTIEGFYGDLIIDSTGAYTYSLDNSDTDTQALNAGEAVTEVFTYTITDGNNETSDTDTETLTFTVNGANDATVNSMPGTQAVNVGNLLNLDSTGGPSGANNAITVADVDIDLVSITVSVSEGTFSVTDQTDVSVSGDNTGTVVITATVSGDQNIQTALQNAVDDLVYDHQGTGGGATAASGGDQVTLTVTSRDAQGLTDVDISNIYVVNGATAPEISTFKNDPPPSTGLLRRYYDEGSITLQQNDINGTGDNGPSTTYDSSDLETHIKQGRDGGITQTGVAGDSPSATPDRVSRDTDGIGRGVVNNSPNVLQLDNDNEVMGGENSSLVYTGLVYLEAGVKYDFAGFTDYAMHIELGGQVMYSTQSVSGSLNDPVGFFNAALDNIDGTQEDVDTTLTPITSGYYTLEIYGGNIDSNGYLMVNLRADDVPAQLSVQNYHLYASADDVIDAGGALGTFVPNGSGGGGHFPADTTNDLVGVDGQNISLASIGFDTTNGDVVTQIVITGVPTASGVTLRNASGTIAEDTPGSGTYTINNPAGVDMQGLALVDANLTNIPSGSLAITVAPTATTLTGVGAPATASVGAQTIDIGILASNFEDGIDPDINNIDDSNDEVVYGSGVADTLTASSGFGVIIHGRGGDDIITGSDPSFTAATSTTDLVISQTGTTAEGNNTLYGGSGNDTIDGKGGDDLIIGGTGSDILTGGAGDDLFIWLESDSGAVDRILDFNDDSGDLIDVSAILTGENSDNIGGYISLQNTNELVLDFDGAGVGTTTQTIVLEGYTGTLQNLLNNHIVADDRLSIAGTASDDNFNGTTAADENIFSNGITASSFEIAYSHGNNAGNSENGSDPYTAGGSDKYIINYNDIDDPDNNSAVDNVASHRVFLWDFVVADTSTNNDADVLDISDLLRGAINAAGDPNNLLTDDFLDVNDAGELAELAKFFNFNSHPFSSPGQSILGIDLQGAYTSTERGYANLFTGSDEAADVTFRVTNAAGRGAANEFDNATGQTYGTDDTSVANILKGLVDLGFLDIN